MRFDADASIAGFGAVAVRNALRRVRGDAWAPAELALWLDAPPDRALALAEELERRGLLERAGRDGAGGVRWRTTLAGNAFAIARASRPVTRATAERALAACVARAGALRADPHLLYDVGRLILFGSMLDRARERVGDVDLIVELVAREADAARHRRLTEVYGGHPDLPRRNSVFDHVIAPTEDVMRLLKRGSRVLSFHEPSDVVVTAGELRVVYAAPGQEHAPLRVTNAAADLPWRADPAFWEGDQAGLWGLMRAACAGRTPPVEVRRLVCRTVGECALVVGVEARFSAGGVAAHGAALWGPSDLAGGFPSLLPARLPDVLRAAVPRLRERVGPDDLRVDGATVVVARAEARGASPDLADAVRAAAELGAGLQRASDDLWDELMAAPSG